MKLVVLYRKYASAIKRPERLEMTPEELGQFLAGIVLERLEKDGLLAIVSVRGASEISTAAARIEVFRKPEEVK